MILLNDAKVQLCELLKKRFPKADVVINERRSIILEMRVVFNPKVFMDLYINALTGKQSYALIENGKRLWGYDNYRYWHHHPVEGPANHISCSEPSFEKIVNDVQMALAKLGY